jgi:hypothetical protein
VSRSIFALEVCLRADRAPGLIDALRADIFAHPEIVGRDDKWRFYRVCAQRLLAHLPMIERGCWDFFDDDARARRDYDMWFKGMTTEEGARQEPSAGGDPYRPEPRYLTFTMAFTLVTGTPSERAMAALCEVPEHALWLRETFAKLLEGMSVISFASVESDVVYLIPRDDSYALTPMDLSHAKFEYLRVLSG